MSAGSSGDSSQTPAGLEPQPSGAMPGGGNGQMPNETSSAAADQQGVTGEPGSSPEDVLAAYGLDEETFARLARDKRFWTQTDVSQLQSGLQQQVNQVRRQAEETQQERDQAQARSQYLEQKARELLGDEEFDAQIYRFEKEQNEHNQQAQEEAEQIATQMVQQETDNIINRIRTAAFDESGNQLFNPKDSQIIQFSNNYLGWVRKFGLDNDPESRKNAMAWSDQLAKLLFSKVRQSASTGAGQPPTEQTAGRGPGPSRGPQVTRAGGGGGGQPSSREVYNGSLKEGKDRSQAFEDAIRSQLRETRTG